MAQPQWITPAGSLGTISEGVFYQVSVEAVAQGSDVFFRLIAGQLPQGIQITDSGRIEGIPSTVEQVQGVPLEVSRDVTSRFAIRAYTRRLQNGQFVVDRLADRTFTLTITGQDVPEFVTPAGLIGTYYDGTEVEIQLEFTDTDPDDDIRTLLVAGALPPGLILGQQGLISGVITPLVGPPNTAQPGEDATPWDFYPWDFRTRAQSQNFQFAVEITDGKQSNVRSFEIFVYAKDDMTADTVDFTADNTFITADVTPLRTPVLLTPDGSIGITRSDNFFAFRFRALDFDGDDFRFELSAGPGLGFSNTLYDEDDTLFDQGTFGLPTGVLGLTLDVDTGWLTGYIPDQGAIEQTFEFALRVYKVDNPTYISPFSFYELTVTTDIDFEVIWLTDSDLGSVPNGSISVLAVRAVAQNGEDLIYQLASGTDSQLPQGLTLQPSGNITGRVSFNTFAVDGGATTFDVVYNSRLGLPPTTFDMVFDFTVNAYAPSSEQSYFQLDTIAVTSGGSGYSPTELSAIVIESGGDLYDPMDPPTVTIEPPPNLPGNQQAVAGAVTIVAGEITAIAISDPGFGYVTPPAITITGTSGVGAEARAEIFEITVTIAAPPPTANAVQATAGAITVVGGVITAIAIGNPGAGYLTAPSVTITGGGGAGATATTAVTEYTREFAVSVFRRFSVRVIREFNEPYETLYIRAMPGLEDRRRINDLVTDTTIIPEELVYRADDPNFGRARDVVYDHAYGLAAASLDLYVESLELNHYWRDLTLGPIRTAVARDAQGRIIYEVVYSEIVDNLVNNQGVSVGKSVTLPYPVTVDGVPTLTVYPNSLDNMRDQVIDTVGQVSPALPLWMTSKQTNNQVLGFVPAWVIAYVLPGEARRIAYNIGRELNFRLNVIDFEIDRYELDRSQTRNWDPTDDEWTPQPPAETTFDAYDRASNLTYRGLVDYATVEAYSDINERTLLYIAERGGIDGDIGRQIDGRTIVFRRQQGFADLTPDQAFTDYPFPYDDDGYDETGTVYDEALILPVPQRLWVYQIDVQPDDIVILTPITQTTVNDYVEIRRGTYAGQQLYIPSVPNPGQTLRTWSNIPQTVQAQTIFDGNSTRFITPTDRWVATDVFDKYLVFPKRTILG